MSRVRFGTNKIHFESKIFGVATTAAGKLRLDNCGLYFFRSDNCDNYGATSAARQVQRDNCASTTAARQLRRDICGATTAARQLRLKFCCMNFVHNQNGTLEFEPQLSCRTCRAAVVAAAAVAPQLSRRSCRAAIVAPQLSRRSCRAAVMSSRSFPAAVVATPLIPPGKHDNV